MIPIKSAWILFSINLSRNPIPNGLLFCANGRKKVLFKTEFIMNPFLVFYHFEIHCSASVSKRIFPLSDCASTIFLFPREPSYYYLLWGSVSLLGFWWLFSMGIIGWSFIGASIIIFSFFNYMHRPHLDYLTEIRYFISFLCKEYLYQNIKPLLIVDRFYWYL